jgi:hypothetical protein
MLHQHLLDGLQKELISRPPSFQVEAAPEPSLLLEAMLSQTYNVFILSHPHDYSSIPKAAME